MSTGCVLAWITGILENCVFGLLLIISELINYFREFSIIYRDFSPGNLETPRFPGKNKIDEFFGFWREKIWQF
jgi:hypothetical protein